jgi:hypothetical protein
VGQARQWRLAAGMKALFLVTGTNEVLKYAEGFKSLGHEVGLMQYDIPGLADGTLYARIKEHKPDLIVYIGSRWGQQPAVATLAQISNKLAPMVHICSDAADLPWHELLRQYHEGGAFTLQVAIDGSHKWPGAAQAMTALTPVDPANFKVNGHPALPHSLRGIACGYAGNAGGGGASRRTQILGEMLKARAIDIRIRSNLPYTYEAYCDYLGKCRMSLNIAYSGTEQAMHVKGRVIESALAGACLLETKGSPTSYWFRPGLDYLEYESPEEALSIIRYMEKQPDATEAMARSLQARVLAEHTPAHFWGRILERLELKP